MQQEVQPEVSPTTVAPNFHTSRRHNLNHSTCGSAAPFLQADVGSADIVFPLFDLPPQAVELVLASVDDLEDKRALRLVCKRSRASVDSRVVAVKDSRQYPIYIWRPYTYMEAPVGERQLSALVRAPWQLQRLELSRRLLGDTGAASLAAAHWPALRVLELGRNSLGAAGAAALAVAHWPALQELWLGGNRLGAAGVASLAAAHYPALLKLDLSHNRLGDAGAAALAAARWTAVQELCLSGNNLGPMGAASLAAARWPALQELHLEMNHIGDAGAVALAAAHWPALQRMRLWETGISIEGYTALQAHWPEAVTITKK